MKKLAIIHTKLVSIEIITNLKDKFLSDVEIINYLDDSIVPELRNHPENSEKMFNHVKRFVAFANDISADAVLVACSSIGNMAEILDKEVKIPIYRIDEAMIEKAVNVGTKIGVAATAPTTIAPTTDFLKSKAKQKSKHVEISAELIDGDDETMVKSIMDMKNKVDIVVLAQVSMSRLVNLIPENMQKYFLTSLESGLERTALYLNNLK